MRHTRSESCAPQARYSIRKILSTYLGLVRVLNIWLNFGRNQIGTKIEYGTFPRPELLLDRLRNDFDNFSLHRSEAQARVIDVVIRLWLFAIMPANSGDLIGRIMILATMCRKLSLAPPYHEGPDSCALARRSGARGLRRVHDNFDFNLCRCERLPSQLHRVHPRYRALAPFVHRGAAVRRRT